MKRERLADGVVIRGRMRSDLLELPDVAVLLAAPASAARLRDVLAAHVQEAGADRRQQPFVQASSRSSRTRGRTA